MLEFFFSQLYHESLEFRKYAVRYAKAMGLPHTTEEDFMEVFESLADMPSFNFKGPLPKLARCGVGGGVLLVHGGYSAFCGGLCLSLARCFMAL